MNKEFFGNCKSFKTRRKNQKSLPMSPSPEGVFNFTSCFCRLDRVHDLRVCVQSPDVERSSIHHRNSPATQIVKKFPVARPQIFRFERRCVEKNSRKCTVHQNRTSWNVRKIALVGKHVVGDLQCFPHNVKSRRFVWVRQKRNAR